MLDPTGRSKERKTQVLVEVESSTLLLIMLQVNGKTNKQNKIFHLFFFLFNPWAPQSSFPIMHWIYPKSEWKEKKHYTQRIIESKIYQHSIVDIAKQSK